MTNEVKEALTEFTGQFEAKFKEFHDKLEQDGKVSTELRSDLKAMAKDHEQAMSEIKSLKDEMTDLHQKQAKSPEVEGQKSIGEQFVNSEQFKNFKNGTMQKARLEVKNTIVTGGDNSVSRHDKLPGVVDGAFRALSVMPTVMMGATTSNIVYYSRELLWTNNAAGQTEGSAKAQSVLTFEEVNKSVQTIAHFLKVSKQALDDSDFLASYVDRRMRHGVNNALEAQIISGDGTGNNLSGWLATGNFTATDPAGTTDIFGLANKMKYEVIAADYMPDYFYMNPVDWQTMESTRRATGDDAFIAGSGAIAYVNNGLTPLLWGVPVVVSNNIPAGTIVCKSMDADMYASRQGTVVEMFEQDDTNVQSNLVTVRAETRGAALNFRPTAIRTGLISGITAPV